MSKQKDSFWESCRDYGINVIASAYPIDINVDAVRARAERFGVKFGWAWGEEESSHDTFVITPINLAGDGNIKRNFALCGRANNCITLSHGRLFTCTFAPHVRHFNSYFGKSVAITDADFVNIYSDIAADDILLRMAEPIPACRYCDLNGRFIEWGISERKIDEWV